MIEPRVVPADQIRTEPPSWLWADRVPCGAITILEGDPGCGKSTLVYDLAARVSTGKRMPASAAAGPPGGVLLFEDEDPPGVILRNLTASGADLARVLLYDRGSRYGRPLSLVSDGAFLEAEIRKVQARLVVFDPLTPFLDGGVQNDRSVRRALGPLSAICERTGAAAVLVRHLSKAGSANVLYQGAGSIGLIAAARSGLLVARDPADLQQRVIAHFKSNLGPLAPSLAFRPTSSGVGLRVDWLGTSNYTAGQLLAAGRSGDCSALWEAIWVLYSILGEGPVPANEAKALAQQAGITAPSLRRAKQLLSVRSQRTGFGPGSRFFWVLPSTGELVKRLREQDLDQLMHQLLFGEGICDLRHGQTCDEDDKPDDEASGAPGQV